MYRPTDEGVVGPVTEVSFDHCLRVLMYGLMAGIHPETATVADMVAEAAHRVQLLSRLFATDDVWGCNNGMAAEAVVVAIHMVGLPLRDDIGGVRDWWTLPICTRLTPNQEQKFYHKPNIFPCLPASQVTHVNMGLALFCPWAARGCSAEQHNLLFKHLTVNDSNTPIVPVALGILHHRIFTLYCHALTEVGDYFARTPLQSVPLLRTAFAEFWFSHEQQFTRAICDVLLTAQL